MSSYSKEVTSASFDDDVLRASSEVPVIVDFWAPWCAPCKALKPILEKLAAEYLGKFTLAKVDTDQDPDLAAQFGVRGIPNVKAFVGGKVVAEFSGAIPEQAVRAFLDKLIPGPADKLRLEAAKATGEGDSEKGERLLREAVALDPAHGGARLDLAGALIARQAFSEADFLLQGLPERERDERAEQFVRQIGVWKRGQSLPGASDLAAALERNPQDLQLRLQLGERLMVEGHYEGALDQLIEVVRADRGALREQARRTMVEVFGLAAAQADLVTRYRRLLSGALY
jgi:putative thioredoxin